MIKKLVQITLIGSFLLSATACTTTNTASNKTLGNTNLALNTVQNTLNGGLSDALSIFGDSDAFLTNALIEAAMPKELKDINSKLNDLGLSQVVDKEKMLISQVANASVSTAKPIVENAINTMTTQDAIAIISGGKGAATQFLKDKSYSPLVEALSPVVSTQLDQLGVNNLLGNALGGNGLNNILGAVLGGNSSTVLTQGLNNAVTEQLANGLFNVIEDAENTTRNNPAGLLNSILTGNTK